MNITHIRANSPWWQIPWREIWEYRDLIGIMWRRDMLAVYKQSVLGKAWFVLQPLMTTLVFTVVFGNIAGIGTDGIPPLMFYMSGMLIWNFFATTMNSISSTFTSNIHLFNKVYFPRLVVPLVRVLVALATLALNILMFIGFWLYYRYFTDASLPPAMRMLWFGPILLYASVLGLAMGLLLSSLTIKYRDMQFFLPFFSQLWMYASPIIYPSSTVSEQWRWIIEYNPMSWAVEATRWALAGKGTFGAPEVWTSTLVTTGLLFVGLMLFNRVQRTFVDIV